MRIMSLDVGSRTIGIACSDALLMTAQGIETIRRTSLEKDFNRLQELISEYEVHELVVGMPKNMNGTKGERAEKTEEFVAKMKEVIDLPVTYWDERLSTVMAERQLIAADVSRKKRKSVIDKMAAVVILQGYLDRLQFNKSVFFLKEGFQWLTKILKVKCIIWNSKMNMVINNTSQKMLS